MPRTTKIIRKIGRRTTGETTTSNLSAALKKEAATGYYPVTQPDFNNPPRQIAVFKRE